MGWMLNLGSGARRFLASVFTGTQGLILLAAGVFGAVWFGGTAALLLFLILSPVLALWPNQPKAIPQTQSPDSFLGDEQLLAQIDLRGFQSASVIVCAVTLDGPMTVALRDVYLDHARRAMRPGDLAAFGKDQRLVLIFGPARVPDRSGLIDLAARMQRHLEEPVITACRMYHMSAAVGLAASGHLGPDVSAEKLLTLARQTAEQAAAHGRSAVVIARPEGQGRPPTPAQIQRADAALKAIELGRIAPWFQPSLDSDTGRVSGAEILARWADPNAGLVAPASFLPALHAQGLLPRLTDAMVQRAAQALAGWDRTAIEVPSLSLNPCDDDLRDPNLARRLLAVFSAHGLSPDRLRIDLQMRHLSILPSETLLQTLHSLHEAGIAIDLEGFGTPGASSHAQLSKLPLSRLKLDRTIIARVDRSEDQRKLVNSALGLAQSLGLETLACGVESHGEHTVLAQLGCSHVMGYGVARPMAAKDLPQWVTDHNSRLDGVLQITSR